MKAYVDLGVKVAIEFGADEEQARRDMEDILDLETNLVNVCKQYHLHVHVIYCSVFLSQNTAV